MVLGEGGNKTLMGYAVGANDTALPPTTRLTKGLVGTGSE